MPVTSREPRAAVIERALSRQGGYASLTGVHGLTLAQRDPGLRHALHEAWMNFPDGAPVAWRQRRNGTAGAKRIAGPDLMPRVIDLGRQHGLRHYLFGAMPSVLERLEQNLLERFPGAQIVGTSSPPFRAMNAPEEREAVATINAASPHIVWIGLGTPKQDLWMHRLSPDLEGVLAMGVGAAFDFISGNRPAGAHVDAGVGPRMGAPHGARPDQARAQIRSGEHGLHRKHHRRGDPRHGRGSPPVPVMNARPGRP